jgi:hypothetical protein
MRVEWYPTAQLLVCLVDGCAVARADCPVADKRADRIARDWHKALGYRWDGIVHLLGR